MKSLIKFLVLNNTKIINFVTIKLFKIGLIPEDYKGKAKSLYFKEKFHTEFSKSKLKYDDKGFYYLNPMPSTNFLNEYYKKTYWQSRNDLNYPVKSRDIDHFKMISNFYTDFNSSKKKILNFGSGHGGVSYLFHAANHSVFNYDFRPTNKKPFAERWKNIETLGNLNLKFDLIYGSHSLEHVNNLENTFELFKNLSHEKTIYFFEVPNCLNINKIYPPHTYYFTREFFVKKFINIDFCKTFLGSKEMSEDQGDVIRFHSRSNTNSL